MKKRQLGRTGLAVSEIALGTVELGLDYGIGAGRGGLQPAEQEAARLLHFALDHGVNLIDTARAYGEAEGIIGRALRGRREEYVLASKVRPQPGQPHAVRASVEESLRQLATDRIDLLQMHCLDGEIEPDADTVGELVRLQEEGKIRFLGSSIYGTEAALAAIRLGVIDCLQVAYSALDRRVEGEVFNAARRHGTGVILRSVVLKGALTSRYRQLPDALAPLRECVDQLAAIAGGVEQLPQFAYRYVLATTPPHAALVGTASTAELSAAIAAAEMPPLDEATLASIRKVTITDEQFLSPANWPPV
jgi:aryl-alcohol dehydrogenase-like predicted oxidoreductase